MPHAVKDMSSNQVNGEKPQSKALNHFVGYPVVHDSIHLYKSHPLGQSSINIATNAYESFGKPFLPLLQGPYSYVRPYVIKADDLADSGLHTVDKTFPIVKADTEEIKQTVRSYASFPFRLAGKGKEYVVGTFNDEYSKTQGQGVYKFVHATISTELKLGIDAFNFARNIIGAGQQKASEKVSN